MASSSMSIHIDADAADAIAQIEALNAAIDQLNDKTILIKVETSGLDDLNAKLAEVKTAEDAVGDKTIKITTDKSQLDEAKTALQDFNTEFDKAVAAAERDSESAGKSIGNLSNDVKNLDNDGKTLGSDLNIAGTAIGDLVSVAGAASGAIGAFDQGLIAGETAITDVTQASGTWNRAFKPPNPPSPRWTS